MTGFDVFLVVVALICIVVSFMLTEKIDHSTDSDQFSEEALALMLSRNQENMKESMEQYLLEVKEQIIDETVQELKRISNEKIMAVDEFSNTVLEKINQNHEEAVFLYNMLNEKDKEVKDVVTSIAKVKKEETKKSDKAETKPSQNNSSKNSKNGKKSVESKKNPIQNSNNDEFRQRVLSMYEEGMSIVEIAQLLNKGQGEIKLIIDLYQGGKDK